jgi:integrase
MITSGRIYFLSRPRRFGKSLLVSTLEAMIATVPSKLHISHEHYYHSLMLIWMRLLGFRIRAEEPNNLGYSDAVWEQPGLTVVAEVKYDAKKKIDPLLGEALNQIHERRYYNKYSGKILLLGIAFSGKQTGCRMEVLNDQKINRL